MPSDFADRHRPDCASLRRTCRRLSHRVVLDRIVTRGQPEHARQHDTAGLRRRRRRDSADEHVEQTRGHLADAHLPDLRDDVSADRGAVGLVRLVAKFLAAAVEPRGGELFERGVAGDQRSGCGGRAVFECPAQRAIGSTRNSSRAGSTRSAGKLRPSSWMSSSARMAAPRRLGSSTLIEMSSPVTQSR